jgi:methyl-accepting chemotaxis protein
MFLTKSNTAAIAKALEVCDAVSNGDFEARIVNVNEFKEFMPLYQTINRLIDHCDAYVRESAACLEYVSDNKYFRRIQEKGMPGAFGHASGVINHATASIETRIINFTGVLDNFDASMAGVVEGVSAASTELESSATSLDETASGTSDQAVAVAAAANQTSQHFQTIAAAAEELVASVGEVTDQVSASSNMAGKAVVEAEQVNAEVQGLVESANNISSVVNLISDITRQTNLIALNATIEAARAGDAGKGFAVVAQEVKNLASQTEHSTEQIRIHVDEIQAVTKRSVSVIEDIGGSIGNIDEVTKEILVAIECQGAASQEIALNIEQAAAGNADVTQNIDKVSAGAVGTRDATGQLRDASSELAQQSHRLNTEVDHFLSEVKKVV